MTSTLEEHGRIRINEGLIISVNRSFQVVHDRNQRPVAAFKGIAHIGQNKNEDKNDVYQVTMAKNDSFWLGFDTDEEQVFAIIPCINGRQAITSTICQSPILELDPKNFLIIPDQPWIDSIFVQNEGYQQMVPEFATSASKKGRTAVKEIRLLIYLIDTKHNEVKSDNTNKPIPLYLNKNDDSISNNSSHLWASRSLANTSLPSKPNADLRFQIVEPEIFQTNTGIQLPSDSFKDQQNELPHNPFE